MGLIHSGRIMPTKPSAGSFVMLESSQQLIDAQLEEEVSAAPLGDRRRSRRYSGIVEELGRQPDASIPEAMGTQAALEGYYRLMRNEEVDHHSLLAPHFEKTRRRAEALERVLVVHDTTEFGFAIHDEPAREHLARPSANRQSFLWHASLVVANDGTRAPMGLAASRPFVHETELQDEPARQFWQEQNGLLDNEMWRWMEAVETAEDRLADVAHPIHVMDCEGDDFGLLFRMGLSGYAFVIRMTYDRRCCGAHRNDHQKLSEVLDEVEWQRDTREITLSARPKRKASRSHPARRARTCRLKIRATAAGFRRPDNMPAAHGPKRLEVNVVEVLEADPPEGEEPVRWVLATSEPIADAEDLWRIVDIYRARWVIEEYFKAIKTGAGYRKLQHKSATTLLNALSAKAVIGWELLRLRHLGRHLPEADAEHVVNDVQLKILRKLRPKLVPPDASAADVMRGVAGLGGHIRQNGPPGWLVLGRGWEHLLEMETGFRLAQELK